MKVALVHDWLNQIGGAECVLEELVTLFPNAPVYTSIFWPDKMPPAYRQWDVRLSFLDRWPLVKRRHQLFLPVYPLAFETLSFQDYDVVISNKSGFCHGIITPASTLHICYCLTPTRYLWSTADYMQREGIGRLSRLALMPWLNYLRLWDRLAADRVDCFLAISRAVQQRIARIYRRESEIIYPPVRTEQCHLSETSEGYYLIVSRLIPYKRIDLAVEAFNRLGAELIVVGDGRDRKRLEAMGAPNIRFTGRLDDTALKRLLAHCKAFIFPGLEDFGIAPVEAQASGRPVIAYAGGGALDTVIEGETGLFFHEQTVEGLMQAVNRLEAMGENHFNPEVIRRHAERFTAERFRNEMRAFVERAYEQHHAGLPLRCGPTTGRVRL